MMKPRNNHRNKAVTVKARQPAEKSSNKRRQKMLRYVVDNLTGQKPIPIPNSPTRQKEDYKSFYLRKSTWEAIRTSRGWYGRGATVRFAESLGVTRQYAWDLITQRCGCSSNVMRKIIALLGMDRPIIIKGMEHYQCWCVLFEMTCQREASPNHPIYNLAKYNGEVPYDKYSPAGQARARDYKVETMGDT
jgi:hypothetical protein